MSIAKRMPTYWPAHIWCSRIVMTGSVILAGISPFLQEARLVSIIAACTLAGIGLGFWSIRRRESREILRFEERPKVPADAFLGEIGVSGSSPLASKVLAVRGRFAELGGVSPDSLRASDKIHGELQHLPFYDSIDYLELFLILEEEMDVSIPEDKHFSLLENDRTSVTIRDLILVAIEVNQQLEH